jgi:cytochrome c-type biogenesis protein CcmH
VRRGAKAPIASCRSPAARPARGPGEPVFGVLRLAARGVLPLLLALAAPLALPATVAQAQSTGAGQTQLEARTFEIAEQLRCPVCVSESVAQSSSQISIEMRQIIQAQLEQGRGEREILAYFQERYGDWILLEPPKRGLHLLVWLLPAAAALAGLIALTLFMRRWLIASREPLDVEESDLRRVREALSERN